MAQVFSADEIFAMGVQIETNGREFYLEAARVTSDSSIRELFAGLADWEAEHIRIFEHLRQGLPESAGKADLYDPDNDVHLYLKAAAGDHVFSKKIDARAVVATCTTPLEAVAKALAFEKDSVVFYSAMKEAVREDLGKSQLDKLIHEELTHIGQLSRQQDRLRNA